MKKLLACMLAVACIVPMMILPVAAKDITIFPPGGIFDEENMYIRSVEVGTTVRDAKMYFPDLAIYYGSPESTSLSDPEVYKIEDGTQILNTGCFVRLSPADDDVYRIIVRADVNGDGGLDEYILWWGAQYLGYDSIDGLTMPEEYVGVDFGEPNDIQLAAMDYDGNGAFNYVDLVWFMGVALCAGFQNVPFNVYAYINFLLNKNGIGSELENLGFDSEYYVPTGTTLLEIFSVLNLPVGFYKPNGDLYSFEEFSSDSNITSGTRMVLELDGVILIETVFYLV